MRLDDYIGKKAYKNNDGFYGDLVGTVVRNDGGLTPLCIELPNGVLLGAYPRDLVIVREDE